MNLQIVKMYFLNVRKISWTNLNFCGNLEQFMEKIILVKTDFQKNLRTSLSSKKKAGNIRKNIFVKIFR